MKQASLTKMLPRNLALYILVPAVLQVQRSPVSLFAQKVELLPTVRWSLLVFMVLSQEAQSVKWTLCSNLVYFQPMAYSKPIQAIILTTWGTIIFFKVTQSLNTCCLMDTQQILFFAKLFLGHCHETASLCIFQIKFSQLFKCFSK